MCVCVCVCVHARACVRVCVCVCTSIKLNHCMHSHCCYSGCDNNNLIHSIVDSIRVLRSPENDNAIHDSFLSGPQHNSYQNLLSRPSTSFMNLKSQTKHTIHRKKRHLLSTTHMTCNTFS